MKLHCICHQHPIFLLTFSIIVIIEQTCAEVMMLCFYILVINIKVWVTLGFLPSKIFDLDLFGQ